jgi:hypothetical protein
LNDENSRKEHEAYLELSQKHRQIAAELRATAERMAGYRDMPMGRHDQRAMSAPGPLEAFGTFVKLEQELLALLQEKLGKDRKMLTEMREAGGGSRPD